VNHTTQIQTYFAPYAQVVTDDFIFVPSHRGDAEVINQIAKYHHRLGDFSLRVSTGKVVDYRNRDQIDGVKSADSFPMIYSSNLKNGTVEHPAGPKGQWFTPSGATDNKMLIPAGTYVLLKRFSAKEENRRLVAAILTSLEPVALDNKLNFVHRNGSGIEHDEATQLAKWFNSDLADQYFRTFSGHTQVNAGDINKFPIPDLNSSLQEPSKRGR
jgi:adenine-specific DNA-methyltransferase